MKVSREKFAACMIALALGACSSSPDSAGVVRGATRPSPTATTPPPGTAGTGAPGGTTSPGTGTAPGDFVIKPSTSTIQSGAAGAGLKDGQCARQDVPFTRVTPTVWLVLDGSGSMLETLADRTRWDALREALMEPTTGVVKTLENDVHWGMVMYDGPGGLPAGMLPDGGTVMFSSQPATSCPRVVSVEPKVANFNDINMVYPPTPLGGSTPTDKALEAVIAHLPDSGNMQVLDGKSNPTIVVLATDGAPNDFCSQGGFLAPPPDVRPNVVNAVKKLAESEIKTYVISLAGGDAMLTQHLTEVAAAGKTGMPPFIPMNKDQLVQTFRDIIGPGAACDIVLNGKVKEGSECKGKILINGKELPCNDPNGWKLTGASTISIQGTACEQYKADKQSFLQADFPCDLISLN